MEKKHPLPKHVYRESDRHGNVRHYFKRGRGHRKIRIREEIGTAEWHVRIAALVAEDEGITLLPIMASTRPIVELARPETLWWLCQRFFASPEFKRTGARTQRVRRGILESCCQEKERPGSERKFADFPLDKMTLDALEVLRDRKGDKLGAADNRVKALRMLFKWAKRKRLVAVNIATELEYVAKDTGGYVTWSPEQLSRYEKTHALGTPARLALDLLQYLGTARMDVVVAGPGNVTEEVKDGVPVKVYHYKRGKSGSRPGGDAWIRMSPQLLASIEAMPLTGTGKFLVNAYGRPFSAAGFGNRFKKWVRAASLPENISAHGVRKAAATRAAENGATPHELQAMFGWLTLKQAELYTRTVNRRKLGTRGGAFLQK